MRKIILASASPRRKELLRQIIGDNFEIKESSYEEDNSLDMDPVKLAMHHALEKAKDVSKNYESGVIISADTFVAFENKVLGKPSTGEDARNTLNMLNGKEIEVISGIAVIDIDNKKEVQDYEISKVKMKKMSEEEIEAYIKTGEPLDKAGAFGIQGKGAVFVEKVDGCYSNVVGLPLYKLGEVLKRINISVFDFVNSC